MQVELHAGSDSRWFDGIVVIVAFASFVAIVLGVTLGIPVVEIYSGYATTVFVLGSMCVVVSVSFLALASTLYSRFRCVAECRQLIGDKFGSVDRALHTAAPVLLMPFLLGSFGTFKQVLPLVVPFGWDDTLASIGRLLCLGYYPWQVTHALFGAPVPTMILDQIYTAWVPVMFVVVIGMALIGPSQLRAQFFVALAGAWLLLGVVGAFAFPSAGPCFSALIGSSSAAEFTPLMARLNAINAAGYRLTSLEFQQALWDAHASHRYGFALGISAMPSMHNSIAFIYALSARRAHPLLRTATYLFTAAILVGSVHLGWHYLSDGLFAWAATWAIWRGAGAYVRRCNQQRITVPAGAIEMPEVLQEPIPELLAA